MHDYALNWTTHITSYALNICYTCRPTEQNIVLATKCHNFPQSFHWLDISCSNFDIFRDSSCLALTFYSNKHNCDVILCQLSSPIPSTQSSQFSLRLCTMDIKFRAFVLSSNRARIYHDVSYNVSFLLTALVFCIILYFIIVFLLCSKITMEEARSSDE